MDLDTEGRVVDWKERSNSQKKAHYPFYYLCRSSLTLSTLSIHYSSIHCYSFPDLFDLQTDTNTPFTDPNQTSPFIILLSYNKHPLIKFRSGLCNWLNLLLFLPLLLPNLTYQGHSPNCVVNIQKDITDSSFFIHSLRWIFIGRLPHSFPFISFIAFTPSSALEKATKP